MPEDYAKDPGLYWRDQLEHAKDVFDPWEKRADMVVARYRDERSAGQSTLSKFNILWSNVQLLTPSLYGRPAKPEVSRRHMDADPVGRLASTILERTLDYEATQFPDFDATMQNCVEDRLLSGRGTAWIRYEPIIGEDRVDEAHSPIDYVYWKDFRHSPARTWEEVWWVARRVYMTDEEGEKRFEKTWGKVKLQQVVEDESHKDKSESPKKAAIWEICNKRTKRVCWVCEGTQLDEKDDFLLLEGFFPCPPPLYATTTNGSLIPVPDYCQYQDQASEIDSLTGRIDELVKAVRVAGVFNAEFKSLGRLFQTPGNKLIPVDGWQAFAEKQGLKGAIDIIDLQPIAQALGLLYNAREAAKQAVYETTGLSDILRGSSKAEETLGAQQIKANFGSLRLRSSQVDVARFASDIFRLKAQIICRFYPGPLLVQMSGVLETEDGRDQNLVFQALDLLSNSTIRDFHIAVESDSLAQIDEAQEKQEASEMIAAIGGFLTNGLEALQLAPQLLPFASETLLATIRRFKGGRQLEASAERSIRLLAQRMLAAQQNPQPSEAQIEAQTQIETNKMQAYVQTIAAQQKAQFDKEVQQSKLAAEAQLESQKSEFEKQKMALDGQIKLAQIAAEDDYKRWSDSLKAETAIAVAQIGASSKAQAADKQLEGEKIKKEPVKPDAGTMAKLDDTMAKVDMLVAEAKKPKNKKAVFNKNGRIIGVEVVEGPVQ